MLVLQLVFSNKGFFSIFRLAVGFKILTLIVNVIIYIRLEGLDGRVTMHFSIAILKLGMSNKYVNERVSEEGVAYGAVVKAVFSF